MKYLEKRITKLERSLNSSHRLETLDEMFEALQRGEYGPFNLASLVVDILAHGRSVDHLRGELPDKVVDFLAESVKKFEAEQKAEKPDSL